MVKSILELEGRRQSAVRCTLRLADFVRRGPADVYRIRGTCCIWVTTSIGASAMFPSWEGTCVTLHELLAPEESMSFQVVRHEHPDIFVLNRQTYETYRFIVGDNVMLSLDRAPSDLSKARRTAIAFLAQSQTKSIPRR